MKPSRRADVRRARHALLHTLVEKIDLSDVESLFADLGDAAEDAARPAAHAAAKVFYDAAKANVAALGEVTGNLAWSIYRVFSRDNSGPGRATYHVSWNAMEAPHGGLVEYGHWQRYAVRNVPGLGWRTLIRPGMHGKKKPKRGASQAAKDAYYVPRPGGPVYMPGKAFMRRALGVAPQATEAATDVLLQALGKVR